MIFCDIGSAYGLELNTTAGLSLNNGWPLASEVILDTTKLPVRQ